MLASDGGGVVCPFPFSIPDMEIGILLILGRRSVPESMKRFTRRIRQAIPARKWKIRLFPKSKSNILCAVRFELLRQFSNLILGISKA
jgi:hypothetical protein